MTKKKLPQNLKVKIIVLKTTEYCVANGNEIIGRFSKKTEAIKLRNFYKKGISKFTPSQIKTFGHTSR